MQVIKYGIVALVCLPVFFINIKSSHDWGDDFAQYLHQAKNINDGIPQSETGYIYNPQFPMLGPPSYPIGFPLILSPAYSLFGLNIHALNLYMSLFLFALGLLMFYFFQKHFSSLISTMLVIIFIYNPWTLNFKMEVMSDIPFTALLLLCVGVYTSSKPFTLLKSSLFALLIGLLISMRSIGLVFVLAIVFDLLNKMYIHYFQQKQRTFDFKIFLPPVIISVGGFITYLVLNKVVFQTVSDGLFSYSYLLNVNQLKHFVLTNLHYYMAVLRSFFETWNDEWQFVPLFSGTMIFAFTVLGMIKKMSEKIDFIDVLVLFYLTIIIIYPYSNAGFRFLLPLIPFLLYYAVTGLKSVNIQLKTHPIALAIALTGFVLLSYHKGLSDLFAYESSTLQGPQEEESIDAFNYINKNMPAKARFNFIKPRALALYTNCMAMSTKPRQSLQAIQSDLNTNSIQYILINTDISDDSLKKYVGVNEKELVQLWNNSKYVLYKRN